MKRTIYDAEHEAFRETVREYIERELVPHQEKWETERIVDRSAYTAAGKYGLIGFNMPEEYGGGGADDFRFNAIIDEELARSGAHGPALSLHNDVVGPYFKELANDEQKKRWMPGIVSGDLIIAIAMTEPGAGSDLAGIRTSAVRDGDDWILNGSKTFISSGINCDLCVVVARTDPPEAGHKGFTLLVVERDMEGFTRGRKLDKMGAAHAGHLRAALRERPRARGQRARQGGPRLLPPDDQPAVGAAGHRDLGLGRRARRLGGDAAVCQGPQGIRPAHRQLPAQPVPARRDGHRARGHRELPRPVPAGVVDGELTAVEAAKAKWWATEVAKKVIDSCVQLHGGYGYMMEYRVARAYVDGRIQTIFGGTTEIMKEIIGRDLGL